MDGQLNMAGTGSSEKRHLGFLEKGIATLRTPFECPTRAPSRSWQMGVGGVHSWGARPDPEVMLPPHQRYRVAFHLRPFEASDRVSLTPSTDAEPGATSAVTAGATGVGGRKGTKKREYQKQWAGASRVVATLTSPRPAAACHTLLSP